VSGRALAAGGATQVAVTPVASAIPLINVEDVMKFKSGLGGMVTEMDMTPMIDMTFQLLAFFMIIINFSENDQNDAIKLPKSVLAKPPDRPLDFPITLHVTKAGNVIYGADEMIIPAIPTVLRRERSLAESEGRKVGDANVIIRADRQAKTGKVQELIKICQENQFEKFVLRAMEEN
jgi:biopolymer transport protein ExbD